MAKLNKKEVTALRKILTQVPAVDRRCFVNAQRVTMYAESGEFLYHEGTMCGGAHAWNTINGKIIDISNDYATVIPKEAYHLYEVKRTYTANEVLKELTDRGCFSWLSDPT